MSDFMPRTVEEGFRDFLIRLTPSDTESQAAMRHRASIEQCIRTNFGLKRFFRIGSFGNGTSISGFSDVDYFAEIPTENLTENSYISLCKIRNALDRRFPNTRVRVNTPAVLVPFGNKKSEYTEVVPADYIRKENDFTIYDIPAFNKGWMKSSPDAHNTYVARINQKSGYKVKHLVRFLKAWKYYRGVPISSFYLELQAARYANEESSIIYSIDVRNILVKLLNNELAKMQDPMGIGGYIEACSTQGKYDNVISKLERAVKRADKAREAERSGKIANAFHWWRLVFSYKFPTYYR
jgi:hypothetical protein